ncbi:MAG: 7-cyano-7-deazaguanine synthase [Isosphaeraceae bacterium]
MPDTSRDDAVAVLVSGGIDSAILSVDLLDRFRVVHPIYVRFGLRWEAVELACLERFLDEVRGDRPGLMPLTILDEPVAAVYGAHWSTAGRTEVPEYDSPDEAVYLPGRNILLAAKAAVWCRLRDVQALAFGVLRGNPFPDSTPAFFQELAGVLNRGMDGRLAILRPFEQLTKVEVLQRGAGLPLHLTLSCLDPIEGRHCGHCNKCAERQRAFERAGMADRTSYALEPHPAPGSEPAVRLHD